MPRGRPRRTAAGKEKTPPKRRKTSTRNGNRRPVVISLDVTSSSEDEENVSCPNLEAVPKDQFPLTPSPVRCGRGLMSDSSDSDCVMTTHRSQAPPEAKKVNTVDAVNVTLSDSDFDLYEVDYNFHHQEAMKSAYNEINALKDSTSTNSCEEQVPNVCEDREKDVRLIDDDPNRYQKNPPVSPTLLDLEALPKRKRIKTTKKTKKALNQLKALTKEIAKKTSIDDNLNLSICSDVAIMSDYEDDVDTVINLRVKWGSDYLRIPVKTFQKFSHLYQELAERFSVSVSQVVLSHNDKVINSALSPKDLGVTIADIIEGGIRSQASCDMTETVESKNPDYICLKVQNADRKGALNINISRYDKMIVLMQKYAEEKNIDLKTLKFYFDGEILDSNETSVTLDMDDGECIDVYQKL